jgi:hypothetical protein
MGSCVVRNGESDAIVCLFVRNANSGGCSDRDIFDPSRVGVCRRESYRKRMSADDSHKPICGDPSCMSHRYGLCLKDDESEYSPRSQLSADLVHRAFGSG